MAPSIVLLGRRTVAAFRDFYLRKDAGSVAFVGITALIG
jgi:hypothetical protein